MRRLLTEMENEDRQHKIVDMIKKIVSIHKPEGVVDVEVEVEPSSSDGKDFYYLNLTYVVPSDSEHLKVRNFRDKFYSFDKIYPWNRELKKTIEDFLNTNVIINSHAIRSTDFNLRKK